MPTHSAERDLLIEGLKTLGQAWIVKVLKQTKTNIMSKHPQQLNIQGSDLVNLLFKHGLEEGLNALITTVLNGSVSIFL
jgi:hypothetical protein